MTKNGLKLSGSYETSVFFQPMYDYIIISFLKKIWNKIFGRDLNLQNPTKESQMFAHDGKKLNIQKKLRYRRKPCAL